MATVRRYSAQGEVPVQQAQLIDPSGFRPDTSSAEALKAGADVVNTFAELAIRKQAAEDSTAANAASESRTLAELEMQQFMITNPDPDTWKEGRAKILAKQAGIYSSQKFSAKARKDDDIRQKAFINKLNIRTEIAETSQKIENNITISGKNLIDLLANDDGTPEDALGIKEQMEDYQDALERKTTPELAELQMEETIKEGKKGFYINQSKLFPEDTIQQMEKKKKALGKGGKDKEGLGAKDYDDIIISATATKNRAKSASKLSASAATKDSYAKIIKGDMDIASMVLAIQNDPTISDEDSNTTVEKVKTFFTTWNSAIDKKIVTSDSTRIKALKIISAVRTADITEDEGLSQYDKLAKAEKINGIDGKGFISDIFSASKLAETDPLSTNRAKIYFGNLEVLYEDGDIEALEFDKMHTALRDFFKQQPPPTPEQASKFFDELISPAIEGTISKAFNFWVQSPFGVFYRKAKGIEKEGKGELVEKLQLTPEIARQYLNLAGGDRKRAEQLAKDAGYEW